MVESDPGMMGGATAHEFMAPSAAGEDEVALCACGYAANRGTGPFGARKSRNSRKPGVEEVATPDVRTIDEVSAFLDVDPALLIKSLLVITDDGPVLAMVRGDQELQESKLGPDHRRSIGPAISRGDQGDNRRRGRFYRPGRPGYPQDRGRITRSVAFSSSAPTGRLSICRGVVPGNDFEAEFADIRRVKADESCPHVRQTASASSR